MNLDTIDIEKIIEILKTSGSVIAIKTDTIYALVCNAYDEISIKKIYEMKQRCITKPISIFVKDVDEIQNFVDNIDIPRVAKKLMNKYWPGPLTIIFKKKDNVLDHLTYNKDSIGIRIPNDKTILEILSKVDFPLAETSCNISGQKPMNDPEEIKNVFGKKLDLIVKNNNDEIKSASTVVSVESGELIIFRIGDIKIDA